MGGTIAELVIVEHEKRKGRRCKCIDGPFFVFKLIETNAYLLRRRIQIKPPIPAIKVQIAMLAGSGIESTAALKEVVWGPLPVCVMVAFNVSQ